MEFSSETVAGELHPGTCLTDRTSCWCPVGQLQYRIEAIEQMGTPHARPDLDCKADVQAMGHIINAYPMQIVR